MESVSYENYKKIVLDLLAKDRQYHFSNSIFNVTAYNGKVQVIQISNLYNSNVSEKSVALKVLHIYYMLTAWLIRFYEQGSKTITLSASKEYKVSFNVTPNGADIISKKGFGVSIFTDFNAFVTVCEEGLKFFVSDLAKKSRENKSFEILDRVHEFLISNMFLLDIDKAKMKFINENLDLNW